MLKYKHNIERALEVKIINILSPVVGGEDKVVARVNADFDFSQRKSLQEIYDPNNVVRSEQNLEEKREGGEKKEVGGVPGAVSNIGPVQGLEDNGSKEKYEKTQNTTNYEVGKTVNEIKGEFGLLTRLSAAVVVDGRYKKVLKDGVESIEYVPMSEEEIERRFIKTYSKHLSMVETPSSQKEFSFNQLKIYYSSRGYHLNDETLVDNLHLKTDDGRYNFLAELLSDKNRISIKVARFQGEDKSVLLEKSEYGYQCL